MLTSRDDIKKPVLSVFYTERSDIVCVVVTMPETFVDVGVTDVLVVCFVESFTEGTDDFPGSGDRFRRIAPMSIAQCLCTKHRQGNRRVCVLQWPATGQWSCPGPMV